MSRQDVSPEPRIYSPFLKLMLMLRERRLAAIVGRLGADWEASNEDPTASGITVPRQETAVGPLLTMILAVSGTTGRNSNGTHQAANEMSSTSDRQLQPIGMRARLCCRVIGQ